MRENIMLETKNAAATLKEHKTAEIVTRLQRNPYLAASTSENTKKAYQSDIRHFQHWGGLLPATANQIAAYLQHFADKLNPTTLQRRLIALSHWHEYQNFSDPTANPTVKKILIGIKRIHGKPKMKATPLLLEDIEKITAQLIADNSLRALRDLALLQIGFFGALRRSELANLKVEHLHWHKEGLEILIHTSKTDQTHEGQVCALPFGKNRLCAPTALKNWLQATNIQTGYIFVSFSKSQKIKSQSLTSTSINHIIKNIAKKAGLVNHQAYSGHSLRRGLATTAAKSGAAIHAIMRQGRWKHVNTVMEYVDAKDRFSDNVLHSILNSDE
jgi:site-specific recombinase XerD